LSMIRKSLHAILILFPFLLLFTNCVTSKLKVDHQPLKRYLEQSKIFENSFTGFSLFDPEKQDFLYHYNDERFFTPASNTKLFTFYAGKRILGDSIPGIRYLIRDDTLYFTGTGDPSFLDRDFQCQPVFDFLYSRTEVLAYIPTQCYDPRFGPGWAWDDYMYHFSPEKSAMPIYSNVLRLFGQPGKSLSVTPARFKRSLMHLRDSVFQITRAEDKNEFKIYHDQIRDTIDRKVPFRYTPELMLRLLSDTLRKPVYLANKAPSAFNKTLYSQPVDSVMKKMLIESDNFLAEQILVMASAYLSDSLKTDVCIKYATQNYFPEMKDLMHWVDGSGLSRYNKFTPLAMVMLLQKIYEEYPRDMIAGLFPVGGVSGTLKNIFKYDGPYVIAKTGSMSNVYNLSGFLITKKGHWLIFSFMNNNFEVPTEAITSEMEKILKNIYLKF
jgi:D-alanyl-D-alanine carboxypeptidase/D-alanyl-D-alanine-endopeptidase (penicillin-binding protein 4)